MGDALTTVVSSIWESSNDRGAGGSDLVGRRGGGLVVVEDDALAVLCIVAADERAYVISFTA